MVSYLGIHEDAKTRELYERDWKNASPAERDQLVRDAASDPEARHRLDLVMIGVINGMVSGEAENLRSSVSEVSDLAMELYAAWLEQANKPNKINKIIGADSPSRYICTILKTAKVDFYRRDSANGTGSVKHNLSADQIEAVETGDFTRLSGQKRQTAVSYANARTCRVSLDSAAAPGEDGTSRLESMSDESLATADMTRSAEDRELIRKIVSRISDPLVRIIISSLMADGSIKHSTSYSKDHPMYEPVFKVMQARYGIDAELFQQEANIARSYIAKIGLVLHGEEDKLPSAERQFICL